MFDRFYKAVSKDISLYDNKKYITADIRKTEKNERIRDRVNLTAQSYYLLNTNCTPTTHLRPSNIAYGTCQISYYL